MPMDKRMIARFLEGEIEYHALLPDERRAAILELVRRGYVPSSGALRIKRNTYNHAKRRELAGREYVNPESTPNVPVDPPCIGHEDLFTRTPLDSDEITLALSMCRRCPVREQCEEIVQPKRSLFDGVCAGRYWVNGVVRAGA